MNPTYPDSIPICHDDYHARHVGTTRDGNQFFLTTPFVPATDGEGCEFIALYRFDARGRLLSARIDNLGPRATLDESAASQRLHAALASLGEFEYGDIRIAPFRVEKFGVEFGLLPIDPEFVEDEEDLCLEVQPGNVMAFYPPWDGDYDT